MVRQTGPTEAFATGLAVSETIAAERVMAGLAGISTTRTEVIATSRTVATTVFTDLMFAGGTGATLFLGHRIVAVSTG